jgi:methanogenic corrinoid protein MtbC1
MQIDTIVASSSLAGSLAGRYLGAQLSGDRREALRLVELEALDRGMAVPDIHIDVIQAAQYEIGRLWEESSISVAQEHVATAISQLVLGYLYPRLPREPRTGKKVMVACVEGELHDLGARMCADFLEMGGFDVRFLGASVPADILASEVQRERPHALALSTAMIFHEPALRETIKGVRKVAGRRVPILVGGQALTWDPTLGQRLDVEGSGKSAIELVKAVRAALERS